ERDGYVLVADRLVGMMADPVLAADEQHRHLRSQARGRDGIVAGAATEFPGWSAGLYARLGARGPKAWGHRHRREIIPATPIELEVPALRDGAGRRLELVSSPVARRVVLMTNIVRRPGVARDHVAHVRLVSDPADRRRQALGGLGESLDLE